MAASKDEYWQYFNFVSAFPSSFFGFLSDFGLLSFLPYLGF
jgi:hypothetical protein